LPAWPSRACIHSCIAPAGDDRPSPRVLAHQFEHPFIDSFCDQCGLTLSLSTLGAHREWDQPWGSHMHESLAVPFQGKHRKTAPLPRVDQQGVSMGMRIPSTKNALLARETGPYRRVSLLPEEWKKVQDSAVRQSVELGSENARKVFNVRGEGKEKLSTSRCVCNFPLRSLLSLVSRFFFRWTFQSESVCFVANGRSNRNPYALSGDAKRSVIRAANRWNRNCVDA
jgi:hypothetical protein